MRALHLTTLTLALLAAFPASAQTAADVLKELEALKAKVSELEKKLKAQEDKKPEWGMTPDQAKELNRVTVKTEALEDSRDAAGMKLFKVSGWAEPTYIFNRNQGRGGFQFLNTVADGGYSYDNSYFGTVGIDFQKETDSGTRYRLTLVPNRGTDSVIGNGGVVHEATVSVPLGILQTRLLDVHVPDWSGYEFLQPQLNKLITHNLLFDYTLPTSYTGAGLELTRGKWVSKVMLANMNASKNREGEKAGVLTYRVDYARGEFQGFGFAGVHGKATHFGEESAPKTRVDLFEVDGYFIRGDWTVQGQFSIGRHKEAAITPDPDTGARRDATWYGLSALAAYKFNPRFEGIMRVDHIWNQKNGGGLLGYNSADGLSGLGPDTATGADPNQGANRMAISMGLSYLWDMNTTFKVEYRLDRATLPVFDVVSNGTTKKSNQLFGASVVVQF
ncbi:MAG: DUF3138 family protein [Rubrivivax sp.]